MYIYYVERYMKDGVVYHYPSLNFLVLLSLHLHQYDVHACVRVCVCVCVCVREHWACAGIFQNRWGYKWMQSGSSSRSGCNRGAAVEADAIGGACSSWSGRNRGAAAEADAIRELLRSGKSSWSGCKRRAATEADAIREHQLCIKSCPAPDYSRRRTRRK